MNITFIYRSKKNNAHSIENVFDTVIDNINGHNLKITKYYKEKSLLKTVKELRALSSNHYHITGDVYYLALFLPRSKTTMTVHDIGSYKNHKKTLKVKLIGMLWFYLPMMYLKRFTVISKFVAEDIEKTFSIPSRKISIISNPLTIDIDYSKKKEKSKSTNILQIGTGDHKNLIGLIEAVKDIKDIKLTIVGDPEKRLISRMEEYQISYKIFRNISNDEIKNVYAEVDILYFASFSEGFGLPILEAQSGGIPVITSNLQPMTDVGNDSVLYVEPHSSEDIRSAILQLIDSRELNENLIQKGFKNIKRFAPKLIADQYYSFFQKNNIK